MTSDATDATPCPTFHDLPDRLAGFTSWADLLDVLGSDWLSLHDGSGRRLLHLRDALGLVEGTGLLRARERRGLHRHGFRLERSGDLRLWVWLLPDDPPPGPTGLLDRLRRGEERSTALRVQALAVLRDVLGADLSQVSAAVPADDDLWPGDDEDEEDLDDDACPGGGCPCGG